MEFPVAPYLRVKVSRNFGLAGSRNFGPVHERGRFWSGYLYGSPCQVNRGCTVTALLDWQTKPTRVKKLETPVRFSSHT